MAYLLLVDSYMIKSLLYSCIESVSHVFNIHKYFLFWISIISF